MPAALSGIFVPNIAPYTAEGRLNESELRRIVDWLIDKGVSGLYPNGSLGEFIRLSAEERQRVIRVIAEQNAGRVPLLAGAAEAHPGEVLEMCRLCADLGCRAVSITGPYYFKPTQEAIETYFRDLAAKSPIDIVVYNIPAFASEISLPVLERLAMDCPRIIGTKDSSADQSRMQHILNRIKRQRPDFSVLVGWEELLVPAMLMGADGGTLSTAGVAPEIVMKMHRLCQERKWDAAAAMQLDILKLFRTMLEAPNFPTGFRMGYEVRGFDVGPARFPNSPREVELGRELRNQIACLLQDHGFGDLAVGCRREGCGMDASRVEKIVRAVMRELEGTA